MSKQNFGLGRGLGSLIQSSRPAPAASASGTTPAGPHTTKDYFSADAFEHDSAHADTNAQQVVELPVGKITAGAYQPRKHFNQKSLDELAHSIKLHGILQPLIVVRAADGYELVAGERRLRAAEQCGLATVPAIIREYGELERLELALIENIQRADLNPIEEAAAFQMMNDQFGLTHDQIGERVGKSRPVISNAIRLLGLPSDIQKALADGRITEGHAKVLLEIKDHDKRNAVFQKVINEKLTISDTAQEVKRVAIKTHTRKIFRDPNLAAHEDRLREALGTKVSVKRRGKHAGIITIEYYGEEELGALMEKLT